MLPFRVDLAYTGFWWESENGAKVCRYCRCEWLHSRVLAASMPHHRDQTNAVRCHVAGPTVNLSAWRVHKRCDLFQRSLIAKLECRKRLARPSRLLFAVSEGFSTVRCGMSWPLAAARKASIASWSPGQGCAARQPLEGFAMRKPWRMTLSCSKV